MVRVTLGQGSGAGSGDFAGLEGVEVGLGLSDGFGICLALGVLGERPVDAGDGGVLSFAIRHEQPKSQAPMAMEPAMIPR
ncbi:hypothetical protein ACWC0C_45930 [Streptomyces sp. NPDC001709]